MFPYDTNFERPHTATQIQLLPHEEATEDIYVVKNNATRTQCYKHSCLHSFATQELKCFRFYAARAVQQARGAYLSHSGIIIVVLVAEEEHPLWGTMLNSQTPCLGNCPIWLPLYTIQYGSPYCAQCSTLMANIWTVASCWRVDVCGFHADKRPCWNLHLSDIQGVQPPTFSYFLGFLLHFLLFGS